MWGGAAWSTTSSFKGGLKGSSNEGRELEDAATSRKSKLGDAIKLLIPAHERFVIISLLRRVVN